MRREQDALAVRLRATIGRVSSAAVALACKPRGTVAERFRPHRQRDKTSQIAPPNKAPGQRSGRAAVPSTTPTGGDALRRGHLEGSPNKAPGTRSRARMVDRLVRHRSCPAPQPEKNRQSPNPRTNICSFARKGPLPKTNGSGSFVTGAANDDHGDETQNRELGKDPHGLESARLETRAPPAHVKQSLPQSSKRTPQEKSRVSPSDLASLALKPLRQADDWRSPIQAIKLNSNVSFIEIGWSWVRRDNTALLIQAPTRVAPCHIAQSPTPYAIDAAYVN